MHSPFLSRVLAAWALLSLPFVRLCAAEASVLPVDLRCDWAVNPLGIDSSPPRLSWKLQPGKPDTREARQSAWQVLAASAEEKLAAGNGDLWDSGRRESDLQLHLPYAGRPLRSSGRVFWKVRVWDEEGRVSPWSEPATWTMGALDADGWAGARWITDPGLLRWHRAALGYRSQPAADPGTEKWIQLDLGTARPIDAVVLHGLRHTVAENLGLPRRFKLEAAHAASFADAVLIVDQTTADQPNPSSSRIELKPASGPVAARFLRLTATKLRENDGEICLALAQIVVRSGGRNIAPGATVTASNSLEDERWSAAAIVDGIGDPDANPRANDTLRLRREFTVRAGLHRATLHVCGLGYNEASVNGERLGGRALLTPGWTEPAKTCLYETHDLTPLLRAGTNALGFELAGGMYNVQGGRYVKFTGKFRPLTAIAVLRLEYSDGRQEHVVTDETWSVTAGPVTFANVFGGEDYDARLETPGWNKPGGASSAWRSAAAWAGPGGVLRGTSHASPPFRTFEALPPVSGADLRPGVKVYDFGQNASVMLHLRVHGPRGAAVKIIPGELLKTDGSVERRSSGGPEVWWHYTLSGAREESWTPRFFYQGCRYVQVELTAPEGGALPVVDTIEARVVHSDSPPAGDFTCSNELFNRTRTLIRWAQRSNLAHVITDCPHRERLGWLEQYHLNGPSLRYETDLTRLFAKTFADMAHAQDADGLVPDIAPEYVVFAGGFRDSPEWGAAIILAAWQHYVWTGDDTPLRDNYAAMQRYVGYLDTRAANHLLSHGLGDWYDVGPRPPGRAQLTPVALTATAIYFECVSRLAAIAAHLGETGDGARYGAQAAAVAAAFNAEFFHPESARYATGSQTAQAMPLVLGLVPAGARAAVLEQLVRDIEQRGHAVTAGDVGYRYVLRALADGGRSDVIFAMNNQSEKPGYGYQLARGATSLTEAWNADPRSSQNHFMLGHIIEWFYGDLAGIAPDPRAPGFRNIIVRPQPVEGVAHARARLETPRGPAEVSWSIEAGRFLLEIEVPPNATAEVHLPGVAAPQHVSSGHHTFTAAR